MQRSYHKQQEPSFTVRSDEHARFVEAAMHAGFDPDDPWVGRYVEYEWRHLRHLLSSYGLDLDGKAAVELGCNVGGSAIVMASLGANVSALDIDRDVLDVASANIARYRLAGRIRLAELSKGAPLPIESESQDFALANSVLEYVEPEQLAAIIKELYRVLRPGGSLLVAGTASRLTPREIHSRRWLVNYVPRALDPLRGVNLQRGLSPFLLHRLLKKNFVLDNGQGWLRAREAIHGDLTFGMHAVAFCAKILALAPGWLSPSIEVLARKPA